MQSQITIISHMVTCKNGIWKSTRMLIKYQLTDSHNTLEMNKGHGTPIYIYIYRERERERERERANAYQ